SRDRECKLSTSRPMGSLSSKPHSIEKLCERLDKKLKTELPRSSTTTIRQYYSVVKPFDFLNHPTSKLEQLRKEDMGSTYNFTRRVACPIPREAPSTKKMLD